MHGLHRSVTLSAQRAASKARGMSSGLHRSWQFDLPHLRLRGSGTGTRTDVSFARRMGAALRLPRCRGAGRGLPEDEPSGRVLRRREMRHRRAGWLKDSRNRLTSVTRHGPPPAPLEEHRLRTALTGPSAEAGGLPRAAVQSAATTGPMFGVCTRAKCEVSGAVEALGSAGDAFEVDESRRQMPTPTPHLELVAVSV